MNNNAYLKYTLQRKLPLKPDLKNLNLHDMINLCKFRSHNNFTFIITLLWIIEVSSSPKAS